jgi:hypothetical protein
MHSFAKQEAETLGKECRYNSCCASSSESGALDRQTKAIASLTYALLYIGEILEKFLEKGIEK